MNKISLQSYTVYLNKSAYYGYVHDMHIILCYYISFEEIIIQRRCRQNKMLNILIKEYIFI